MPVVDRSEETPLFSIIMPLYNKEKYIKRALLSVLYQTVSDFEIIIVNDASTDNSLKRAEEIQDRRITIYQRETPGPGGYAARNLGINKATGRFISFLDADDEWRPGYLKRIHFLIQEYPRAGAYFTAYESVYSDGRRRTNKFSLKQGQKKSRYIPRKDFFLAVADGLSPVITSCFTVKKKHILQAGGFPEGKCKNGGDVETWMRTGLLSDFAWSSYKGLLYHTDIENQVTHLYSGPRIPYVYYSVKNLLGKVDHEQGILLKKYANYYIQWNIKRSITRNVVIRELLSVYFKEVNMKVYMMYKIIYSLPQVIRFSIYKLYIRIKNIVRSSPGRGG
jgi:succinoglycan biosynthesis protein ExoO